MSVAWSNSHQRTQFLAVLGDEAAVAALGADAKTVSPLYVTLESLQFWAPDKQWCAWKRHLQAAGRRVTMAVAVAVAWETLTIYQRSRGDDQLRAILTELDTAVRSARLPTQHDVRRYGLVWRDFDSGMKEPGNPISARTCLTAAVAASQIALGTSFTGMCRRSLWSSYLVLSASGSSAQQSDEVLARMRETVRSALRISYV